MSSTLYNRFVKLCKSWPIDESKTTRDFGSHLRNQLIVWFPKGQLSQIKDINELDRQISSLERLCSDVHKKKHTDSRVSKLQTVSLFTKDEIRTILSTKYLKENEETRKAAKKLKFSIKDSRVNLLFLSKEKKSKNKLIS